MITILIFILLLLFFASIFHINGHFYLEGIVLIIICTLMFGVFVNLGMSFLLSSCEDVTENYSLIPLSGETLLSQDSKGFVFRIQEKIDSDFEKPVFQESNHFTDEWYKTDVKKPFIQKVTTYRRFKNGWRFLWFPTKYIVKEKYILYLPMDYELG